MLFIGVYLLLTGSGGFIRLLFLIPARFRHPLTGRNIKNIIKIYQGTAFRQAEQAADASVLTNHYE